MEYKLLYKRYKQTRDKKKEIYFNIIQNNLCVLIPTIIVGKWFCEIKVLFWQIVFHKEYIPCSSINTESGTNQAKTN